MVLWFRSQINNLIRIFTGVLIKWGITLNNILIIFKENSNTHRYYSYDIRATHKPEHNQYVTGNINQN